MRACTHYIRKYDSRSIASRLRASEIAQSRYRQVGGTPLEGADGYKGVQTVKGITTKRNDKHKIRSARSRRRKFTISTRKYNHAKSLKTLRFACPLLACTLEFNMRRPPRIVHRKPKNLFFVKKGPCGLFSCTYFSIFRELQDLQSFAPLQFQNLSEIS